MRGLAAFCVLLFHMFGSKNWFFGQMYVAVDFFFVLSGYVLAERILSLKSSRDYLAFLVHRLIRIYPMLVSVLLFTGAYDALLIIRNKLTGLSSGSPVLLEPKTLVFSLLILQLFYNKAIMVDGPVWSLSAEWIVNLASLLKLMKIRIDFIFALIGLACLGMDSNHSVIHLNQIGRSFYGFGLGMMLYSFTTRERNRDQNIQRLKSLYSTCTCVLFSRTTLIYQSFHLLLTTLPQ